MTNRRGFLKAAAAALLAPVVAKAMPQAEPRSSLTKVGTFKVPPKIVGSADAYKSVLYLDEPLLFSADGSWVRVRG